MPLNKDIQDAIKEHKNGLIAGVVPEPQGTFAVVIAEVSDGEISSESIVSRGFTTEEIAWDEAKKQMESMLDPYVKAGMIENLRLKVLHNKAVH